MEPDWEQSASGISYATFNTDNTQNSKTLIVVRIDPKNYKFEIYENPDKKTAKTIEEIHKENSAAITVNGGFFTEQFTPTGLLIANNQELHPISKASLVNGIIAITESGQIDFFNTKNPAIQTKQITPANYEFAIQNGPVILDPKGNIEASETDTLTASRTAMGVDKDGNIILILIKQSLFNISNSMTLNELAHVVKEHHVLSPLQIHSLINLDGGSSTGLYIDDKYYPEMEKVQNVVLIKQRQNET